MNGTPLADRQDGVSFMSDNVDKHQFPPVHFAFDSYAVDAGDEATLQQVAQFLQGGGKTVIVAGFTDERGTPEYNRGLGERRAQTVRDYLIHQGADAGKIQTVSFGAEMPADLRLERGGLGEESPRRVWRGEVGSLPAGAAPFLRP